MTVRFKIRLLFAFHLQDYHNNSTYYIQIVFMPDSLVLEILFATTLVAAKSNPKSTEGSEPGIHVDHCFCLSHQSDRVAFGQLSQSTGVDISNVSSAIHSLLQEAERFAIDLQLAAVV